MNNLAFMKNGLTLKFLACLTVVIFLAACGKKSQLTVESALGSYVSNQPASVVFGSLDVMSILNKAEYSKIPKFGFIASSYIKELSGSLDLDKGLHFSLNGPFKPDGSPEESVLFMAVKNIDTLKSMAMKQGFDVEEGEGFSYFRDNDLSMAMQGQIAVILIKGGEFDEKEKLGEIIDLLEKNETNERIAKYIKPKGDIYFVANLENAYNTSNTDLSKLPKSKQKEIQELVKEGFVESSTYFENGQLRIELKNHFSEALQKRMVFKTDNNASIRKMLGIGSPSIGLSLNLDMRQAQAWLEDVGGGMEKVTKSLGGEFQMAMALSGGKIYNIIDGQIGFAMFGEAKPMVGVTPDFNLYASFGPNGKGLAELVKNQMSSDDLQIQVESEGLMVATGKNPLTKNGNIAVPAGCEKFGKGGVTFYANLEKMDMASFDLEGAAKMLTLGKYCTVYMDNKGGTIILRLKNNQQNVLKQCGDFLLEEFASQIGGMAI